MSGRGIVLKKTRSYEYASTESPSESLDDTVSLPRSTSDGNSEISEELRGEESGGEGEEEETSYWELYRSGHRSHLSFTDNLGEGRQEEEEEVVHYEVSQLSVSPDNTIFHFLHLDVGEVRKTPPARILVFRFINISGRLPGTTVPTIREISHSGPGELPGSLSDHSQQFPDDHQKQGSRQVPRDDWGWGGTAALA